MDVPPSMSVGPEPTIHTLFEPSTRTWQWVVADPSTKDAVIIDPVLDERPSESGISTSAADRILSLVREYQYRVTRVMETHSGRPQKTSAWYLRTQLRDTTGKMPRICTGKSIMGVQRMFSRQYGIQDAGWADRFDQFRDGQTFQIGELKCQVLHLSGPNLDCYAFVIGHNVFLGDVTHTTNPDPTAPGNANSPFARDPAVMRRLEEFTNGFFFHPPGGEGQAEDEVASNSRPQTGNTSRTDVSSWQHEPTTPKVSIQLERMMSPTQGYRGKTAKPPVFYEMA